MEKNTSKKIWIAAAAVLVILAGVWWIGHHGKKSDNKKSATTDTSAKQTIEGILTAKDSGSLTIKTATGSQVVSLTPDSHMGKKNKNVSISDLAVGDQINVKAIVNPDGSFTASVISKSGAATDNSASNQSNSSASSAKNSTSTNPAQ